MDGDGNQSSNAVSPQSLQPTSEGGALIVRLLADLVRAQPETLDEIVGRAVAELGFLAGANRCYVFEVQPQGTLSNTHEWVAPGVMPVIDDLQDLPLDLLEMCMPSFRRYRLLHASDVATWSGDPELKSVLLEQGIKAVLLVPFWVDDTVIGFIGFDNTETAEPYDASIVSLLFSAADVIGTTLHRLRVQAEREQAREDLERSNQRLARVFDAIPDMIFELDRQGRYTGLAIGPREKMLVSIEERTGRHFGDLLPPDIVKVLQRGVSAAERGEVSPAERYGLVHQGERMWHEMTVAPVGDPAAPDFRMIVIVRDVTETERARRDAERTALVAQLMTNFVIMSDADGRVIWANAAFERKSGYALAEMEGRPLAEFTRASRSDRVVQAEIARAMAARRPFSGELLNVTRSGEEYWVDLNIAFQSSDMPDEGIFVSVATDITDQKRSQELLSKHVEEERRTSEQLRRAVRHTETILDSVEDAIISVDRGGAILSANKATERMFGTPTWELQGHRVESLLKRDDGVALSGVFQGPATVAEGLAGRAHLFDAVRKDGTSFPVELTVSEIEASDAGGAFFIVVIRDISEQKRVERMQSDLLANVSHELRTPLTSVRGTLSLLQGGVLGDIHDQGQKMISAAIRNAQMLESLVDNMLDLEKLTQGKLDNTCTEECLERLIRDAVSLNTSYAAGRSVALAIDEPLPRAKVTVDASRAIQILTNYLSNAVKYSEIGGTVGVRAAIRGSFARVSVVDTGCGIPDDKQGILFQIFAMADTSDVRKMRGTGLGLAIARDLATRMQGRVGLVSKVGVGSEFWVDFPIAEEVIGPP